VEMTGIVCPICIDQHAYNGHSAHEFPSKTALHEHQIKQHGIPHNNMRHMSAMFTASEMKWIDETRGDTPRTEFLRFAVNALRMKLLEADS